MGLSVFIAIEGEIAVTVAMAPIGLVTLLAGSSVALANGPGQAPKTIAIGDLIHQIDENA